MLAVKISIVITSIEQTDISRYEKVDFFYESFLRRRKSAILQTTPNLSCYSFLHMLVVWFILLCI